MVASFSPAASAMAIWRAMPEAMNSADWPGPTWLKERVTPMRKPLPRA